ncbi:MAG: PHP domain-containing protein [Synechococcales cyanobacterium]
MIVAPQKIQRPALCEVWQQITVESCPREYNFHLHTLASDGQMHPHHLIDQALNLGLKGLAITDHHSTRGYADARAYLEAHAPEATLHLWTGVEINAHLLGAEVHILGYDFDPQHPAMLPFLIPPAEREPDASEVVTAIHHAGGLAVLAHPFRYTQSGERLITAAKDCLFDGVEAYYNYKNPNPWFPSPEQTATAERLAKQLGLYTTCGTDSHGLSITRRI